MVGSSRSWYLRDVATKDAIGFYAEFAPPTTAGGGLSSMRNARKGTLRELRSIGGRFTGPNNWLTVPAFGRSEPRR
jgi:hypothetical protein